MNAWQGAGYGDAANRVISAMVQGRQMGLSFEQIQQAIEREEAERARRARMEEGRLGLDFARFGEQQRATKAQEGWQRESYAGVPGATRYSIGQEREERGLGREHDVNMQQNLFGQQRGMAELGQEHWIEQLLAPFTQTAAAPGGLHGMEEGEQAPLWWLQQAERSRDMGPLGMPGMTMPEGMVGPAVSTRGQDIAAQTSRRGQDMSAATQRRAQDLRGAGGMAGGPDISLTSINAHIRALRRAIGGGYDDIQGKYVPGLPEGPLRDKAQADLDYYEGLAAQMGGTPVAGRKADTVAAGASIAMDQIKDPEVRAIVEEMRQEGSTDAEIIAEAAKDGMTLPTEAAETQSAVARPPRGTKPTADRYSGVPWLTGTGGL